MSRFDTFCLGNVCPGRFMPSDEMLKNFAGTMKSSVLSSPSSHHSQKHGLSQGAAPWSREFGLARPAHLRFALKSKPETSCRQAVERLKSEAQRSAELQSPTKNVLVDLYQTLWLKAVQRRVRGIGCSGATCHIKGLLIPCRCMVANARFLPSAASPVGTRLDCLVADELR